MTFENLYPLINYPVSRGTPMISPMVRWEHSEDWFVTKFELQRSTRSAERKIKVSLTDQDFDFIAGHVVDGKISKNSSGIRDKIHDIFRSLLIPSHRLSSNGLGNPCYDTRSHFL